MSYVIVAVREGKLVRLERDSAGEAFGTVSKLRQLGYTVGVRRPADFCLTDTWANAHQEARDMGMRDGDLDRQVACVQYAALRHIADTVKRACAAAVAAPAPETEASP